MKKFIIILVVLGISGYAISESTINKWKPRMPWICKRFIPDPVVCPPCPSSSPVRPEVGSVFTNTETPLGDIEAMSNMDIGNTNDNPNVILWWSWDESIDARLTKALASVNNYRSIRKPYVLDIGWFPSPKDNPEDSLNKAKDLIDKHINFSLLYNNGMVSIYLGEFEINSIIGDTNYWRGYTQVFKGIVNHLNSIYPDKRIRIFVSPYINNIENLDPNFYMSWYLNFLYDIRNALPNVSIYSALQDGVGCAGAPGYGEEYMWRQPWGPSFPILESVLSAHYTITNRDSNIFTRVNTELFRYDHISSQWVYAPAERVITQLNLASKYSSGGIGPSYAFGDKMMGQGYNNQDFIDWYHQYRSR